MKNVILATRHVFLFFCLAGLVVFSLAESDLKWGPNCADDAGIPARPPQYASVFSTIATHFGFIGTRNGPQPKKSHQR